MRQRSGGVASLCDHGVDDGWRQAGGGGHDGVTRLAAAFHQELEHPRRALGVRRELAREARRRRVVERREKPARECFESSRHGRIARRSCEEQVGLDAQENGPEIEPRVAGKRRQTEEVCGGGDGHWLLFAYAEAPY